MKPLINVENVKKTADNGGENARNLLIYSKLQNVNEKSNKIVASETVLQAANLGNTRATH